MYAITSILLPVDFSDVAKNAFRYAAGIAAKTGADLNLLYCIPDSSNDDSPFLIVPYADRLKAAKQDMDKFLYGERQWAMENGITLPSINTKVKGDTLKVAVEKLVSSQEINLLVMGTKGRKNEWEKVLGSKTSYLINQAPCPVLVVPADAQYNPIQRICIATDLNDESAFEIERVDGMFTPYKPEIHFLHIRIHQDKTTNYDLNHLREAIAKKHLESTLCFAAVSNSDVVNGLFHYARKQDCQLVAMYRPEKTWLARTFKASSTRDAILKADLPLLIITNHQ
ncbi:hypothetical protein CEQ90_11795 [Lewinellaceae bacterium SD302]|nr:hypothetical protein CEQ90_11795 [Lewinellaceae bacterium SD302]